MLKKLVRMGLGSVLILFLGVGITTTWENIEENGRLDPVTVLIPLKSAENAGYTPNPWLSDGKCENYPCFQVTHNNVGLVITLYEMGNNKSVGDKILETVVSYSAADKSLEVESDIVHALGEGNLARNGIDPLRFQDKAVLYQFNSGFFGIDFEVGIPYGVLPQYFLNVFQIADQALGKETELSELSRWAAIATNEVDARFKLSSLSERAKIRNIAFGSIQNMTLVVSIMAIVLSVYALFDGKIREYSDTLTDLIPFTGFLGTLIGVGDGLQILGQADITNNVSKALSLGQIGSSLGLAINTTIFAIVCFGAVMVVQIGLRLFATSFTKGANS